MEISTAQYKHCDLVKVTGRIDSSTAPALGEALDKITNAGRFKIVLDLSGVQFLSSAGLRVLIATQKTCKRYNRGEIFLAGIPANIKSVFDLAGMNVIYKFFADDTEAVGAF
jgi:anti-sigma B factor antagonist